MARLASESSRDGRPRSGMLSSTEAAQGPNKRSRKNMMALRLPPLCAFRCPERGIFARAQLVFCTGVKPFFVVVSGAPCSPPLRVLPWSRPSITSVNRPSSFSPRVGRRLCGRSLLCHHRAVFVDFLMACASKLNVELALQFMLGPRSSRDPDRSIQHFFGHRDGSSARRLIACFA
jgi:hypothetical protein